MPNKTPETIPPAAPILIEWFPKADGPVARIIGINPTTNANEVMIIGRKRNFAASNEDAKSDFPARRRWMAYSTIRMAFLANNPISMIKATWT